MRTISAEKIIGIKIWKNEKDAYVAHGFMLDEKAMNKCKLIEFKSVKEFDDFIKFLKYYKKELEERYNLSGKKKDGDDDFIPFNEESEPCQK